MPDLDPAAIMAAHVNLASGGAGYLYCDACQRHGDAPALLCETYRLAAEVSTLRARQQRVVAAEPEFYPDWYDLGIRSQHDEGEPVGNQAYMDWMERVLTAATHREIDWTHVELAVVLDRSVQRDEARRAALDDPAAVMAEHGTVDAVIDAAMTVRSPGDGTDSVRALAVVCREAARLAEVRFQRLTEMIDKAYRLAAEVSTLRAREQRVRELADKLERWPSGPSFAVSAKAIRAALDDPPRTAEPAEPVASPGQPSEPEAMCDEMCECYDCGERGHR